MINVRVASAADAETIQAIYAPVVLGSAISFEEVPPSVEDMRGRILATLETYPYLVAEQEGTVIGYAYASQHRARAAYRWAVDVTVYIAENARRKGVGRRLYETLLPMLKGMGYRSIYAGIALPNEGSVGLHERLGFRHIGTFPQVGYKHGAWHDVGYWLLEQGDRSVSPQEPTGFTDYLPERERRFTL
ncbi:arsinothricin resistance N-acetyltransferase ArsN1 family B [Phytopseudomonas punonensis]|uniref:Phosphinothricin acetyltransferase n=1 Tax=Phytopseudomonas punonensis TaxID=1220495 RepID=A0A1M7FAM7_9GAMM|nr:arsinothricin resistance N-acetyltransferase ArsN1 family B [Pseudomonas punonensis]SHM00808.1 phosphinothricin acetyltransferase [Pseudomonas punonensis]